MMDTLILASASPRRADLLQSAQVPFEVIASSHDETDPGDLNPNQLASHHAREKAGQVAQAHPDRWVLGADTIVVFDGLVYGKPRTPSLAYAHLNDLANQTHEVITAVCLKGPEAACFEGSDSTKVTFSDLSHEEILAYCATEEPMDKAGAYGAQGIGAFFIKNFEGSFSNVVGLPMGLTYKLLKDAGLNPLPPAQA